MNPRANSLTTIAKKSEIRYSLSEFAERFLERERIWGAEFAKFAPGQSDLSEIRSTGQSDRSKQSENRSFWSERFERSEIRSTGQSDRSDQSEIRSFWSERFERRAKIAKSLRPVRANSEIRSFGMEKERNSLSVKNRSHRSPVRAIC